MSLPGPRLGRLRATPMGGSVGIFLALALLVVGGLQIVVQQRVDALRRHVNEVADPTGELIAEVQYLLARQTSALRGFLVSRDSTYLERYDSLRAVEQRIHPALERYAAELAPVVAADVAELSTLSDQWHGRILLRPITDAATTGATLDTFVVLLEQRLYTATLEAAGRAMQAIRQLIRDQEVEIARVERNARLMLGVFFLLAGVVAVFISVLNTRIRSLAAESEARRLEAEMAMSSNERAVAAREYLIRGFTHDVKNPLNVAVGYAELLELGHKGTLPTQQVDMLGRIRSAIHDAVEIINELLEISRLESAGMQVKRKATDLGALTSEVVREHAMAAATAGLDLRFVRTDEQRESPTTFTDPERVRQVLTNLITNALKYTPSPGEVTVRSGVAPKDPDHPGRRVRVMVTDSGPGIPLEEQERIFYEFHRVPGSIGGGHGLGLAISKRISRILGGDLTVESVPGQGATFTLWLPLREPAT